MATFKPDEIMETFLARENANRQAVAERNARKDLQAQQLEAQATLQASIANAQMEAQREAMNAQIGMFNTEQKAAGEQFAAEQAMNTPFGVMNVDGMEVPLTQRNVGQLLPPYLYSLGGGGSDRSGGGRSSSGKTSDIVAPVRADAEGKLEAGQYTDEPVFAGLTMLMHELGLQPELSRVVADAQRVAAFLGDPNAAGQYAVDAVWSDYGELLVKGALRKAGLNVHDLPEMDVSTGRWRVDRWARGDTVYKTMDEALHEVIKSAEGTDSMAKGYMDSVLHYLLRRSWAEGDVDANEDAADKTIAGFKGDE